MTPLPHLHDVVLDEGTTIHAYKVRRLWFRRGLSITSCAGGHYWVPAARVVMVVSAP